MAVKATGVCYSDLGIFSGKPPAPLPMVLGREGTGIVTELGEGVAAGIGPVE